MVFPASTRHAIFSAFLWMVCGAAFACGVAGFALLAAPVLSAAIQGRHGEPDAGAAQAATGLHRLRAANGGPDGAACGRCGVLESYGATAAPADGRDLAAMGGAMFAGGGPTALVGALLGEVAGNALGKRVRAGRKVDAVVHLDDGGRLVLRNIPPPPVDIGGRVRVVDGAMQSD